MVWGREDRIFPAAQVETVRRAMPSARVAVMDCVGHYPQIDAPDAFAEMVGDHIG